MCTICKMLVHIVIYRQLLRQNCPELRQLEAQLKTAYVTKELAAQIAEKEAQKINEKVL